MFLTNKLPDIRQKLKIQLEDIRAHNPNIIYAAGTGAGERGPDVNKGGYDFLSYWCRAGSAMGTTPTDVEYMCGQPGPGYGDSIGGMTIAGGILGALFHRDRTGEALPVDVSLLGVGMWAMSPAIALSLQLDMPWRPGPEQRRRRRAGEPPRRDLRHPGREDARLSPASRASSTGPVRAEPSDERTWSTTIASTRTSSWRPTQGRPAPS